MSNQTPIDKIRDGRIEAAIWEHHGKNGTFYSTTFSRTYSDEQDNPKSAHSYSGTDLLKLAQLAERAYVREQALRQSSTQAQGPDLTDARSDLQAFRQSQGQGHAQER